MPLMRLMRLMKPRQNRLYSQSYVRRGSESGRRRISGHPENFACVGAACLLAGLEITHVNGLSIRIKRAFHKAWFAGDTGGVWDLRRSRGGRGRCAARRRHRHRGRCRRVSRRWRGCDIVTRHRGVGIRSLNRRCIGIGQIDPVKILRLLLRHSIAGRDIQRTPTSSAPTTRRRRTGVGACGKARGGHDQQKCLQNSFHGVLDGRKDRIRHSRAWASAHTGNSYHCAAHPD